MKGLNSFEALPVTNEHPPVHLDASNVRAYKVGQCGTPRADGALVRAKVVLDAAVEVMTGMGLSGIDDGFRLEASKLDVTKKQLEAAIKNRVPRGQGASTLRAARILSRISYRREFFLGM